MKSKNFPFIVVAVLSLLCIAATISSNRLNTNQIGFDPANGNWWILTGFSTTNGVGTGPTNYGTVGRTNWSWMDANGWHNTNNSATAQGVDISKGNMVVQGKLSVGFTNDPQPLSVLNTISVLNASGVTKITSQAFDSGLSRFLFIDGLNTYRYDVGTGVGHGTNSFSIIDSTAGTLTRFLISSNGNIGMGTTTPGERLHVNGNLVVQTNLHVTNGIASYASNLLAVATITVGASPSSWTNTLNKNVVVYVNGVSVTGSTGINGTEIFATIGQNTHMLQPGEWVTITYTLGTPTALMKPF